MVVESWCSLNTCEAKASPTFPVFPSEHAYVDWVSRGIQWFEFIWRLRALGYSPSSFPFPNILTHSSEVGFLHLFIQRVWKGLVRMLLLPPSTNLQTRAGKGNKKRNLVARTTSHSFAAFATLTREILFLPLEHKIHIFSPPCNILFSGLLSLPELLWWIINWQLYIQKSIFF